MDGLREDRQPGGSTGTGAILWISATPRESTPPAAKIDSTAIQQTTWERGYLVSSSTANAYNLNLPITILGPRSP